MKEIFVSLGHKPMLVKIC